MTLAFRNLDLTPEAPVEDWPVEAVLTAIERGSLVHWRRLAKAIDEDPWGPVARRTEEALGLSAAYGITPTMWRVIARARSRAERDERIAVAGHVRTLIEASGLTRAQFAARIGTSASRLSTYATGRVVPSASLVLRMERVAGATAQPESASG